MTLTPEQKIERAARAGFMHECTSGPVAWDKANPYTRQHYISVAGAVLAESEKIRTETKPDWIKEAESMAILSHMKVG